MLYEVMKNIRNFFPGETEEGSYKIENGVISLPFLSKYVLIDGSKFNDGLYACVDKTASGLTDEEFSGNITAVNPPKDFLDLVDEISTYQEKETVGPYTAESFGGYSYQRATTKDGNIAGWPTVFADRLKAWRKV